MKFGVQIENHLGVTYNGVRKIALEAEKSGFDGLFICDHLMGRNEETFRQPCLDPWVTLGALAQATNKIRLGTLVSAVGFRYPSLLAKMGATLDHVSGGRSLLHIVANLADGWNAVGLSVDEYARKLEILRMFCETTGRKLNTIDRSYYGSCLVGNTENEFRESFNRHYGQYRKSEESMETFVGRMRSTRPLIGTATEVAEKMKAFQELGVSY